MMLNNSNLQSLEKINKYSLINESLKGIVKVYQWFKLKNRMVEAALAKVENSVLAFKDFLGPTAACKLKFIDEACCNQLDKFEKDCDFIFGKQKSILDISYNLYNNYLYNILGIIPFPLTYVLNKILDSRKIALPRMFSFMGLSLKRFPFTNPLWINIDGYLINFMELIFNKFFPDIDDTQSVSSSVTFEHLRNKNLSKKTYHRLSRITTTEIDNFYRANQELIENIQTMIGQIKREQDSLETMNDRLTNELLESILQYSKHIQKFISTFKITAIDSITGDMVYSLRFINKNIYKLQIILFESKSEMIHETFFYQTNSVIENIRSGFESFDFHIRTYIGMQPEVSDSSSMLREMSDSYFSLDNEELSDCTLYESDDYD